MARNGAGPGGQPVKSACAGTHLSHSRSGRNQDLNYPRCCHSPGAARQLISRRKPTDSDWLRPEEADQYCSSVAPVPRPVGCRGGIRVQDREGHVFTKPNQSPEFEVR
ncbi:unnamed protein product [Rangifer tarandus platyrhynchus]|uniref:Uncharacterized protein n=1 Tax=Rangifer tarandus platyrhynchus TaxID=3082113 RepID=A0ABN8Y8H7_RANTA|nr:unnamed protein product [Rangifer tarandus platyrhynchus]